MAITNDRFEQGMTYDEFKNQMTRNQERFAENERLFEPSTEDIKVFKEIPQKLNVLVLAEDWCGDVIDNLPILGRLSQESGKLNLRVFLRDQNLDIMDQYLKEGQYRSIPVFVFFDANFNEIGYFIERPANVTERRDVLKREFFAQHPELGSPETPISQMPEDVRTLFMQNMLNWHEQYRAQDNADVVRTVREIIEPVRA